jgi:hypothetical protein
MPLTDDALIKIFEAQFINRNSATIDQILLRIRKQLRRNVTDKRKQKLINHLGKMTDERISTEIVQYKFKGH